jgi:hypothetical protein
MKEHVCSFSVLNECLYCFWYQKIFLSLQITKLIEYLSENYSGVKKLKRTVLCSMYYQHFKRKWEASSLTNPQTHLESVIIFDRNRSYYSKLQSGADLDISIRGGPFLKKKKSDFKTICFKKNQKIPRCNSKT